MRQSRHRRGSGRGLARLEREPLLLRLTFEADAMRQAQIRELVALEQQCCAFLTFTVEETETGLLVSILAPAEAGPTLDGFQTLAERNAPLQVVAEGWTG